MAVRYLLIARGTPERRATIAGRLEACASLSRTYESDHCLILSNREALIPPAGVEAVIGEIYPNEVGRGSGGARRNDPIDDLLSCWWGSYIAVVRECGETSRILRDPSGAIACYYSTQDGLVLVSSDLELLALAAPARRRLDWGEILRILSSDGPRGARTAIEGITELPPGDVLTIEPGAMRVDHRWTPATHVADLAGAAFDDQAMRLRTCIEMVLARLAESHGHAVATISGGLDSSIVALGLAQTVPSIACMTFATADAGGDERRYARLVAERAGASLTEHLLDPNTVDLCRSQAAHLPRPIGRPAIQAMAEPVLALAERFEGSAVFNGTGGDNVFCFLQSATPVVDRVAHDGIARALQTTRDVAHLTGATSMEVAIAALRRARPDRRHHRWVDDRRLLSSGLCRDDGAGLRHPWLASVPRLGTEAHIALLLRIQDALDPWEPDCPVDIINPLLAQPVVECCLGIPTWNWCHGGDDRAVARHAFADLLPAAILDRRWKGGPDSFVSRLIDRQRDLVRSRLHEGRLAERGLLDLSAIHTVLDDPRPIDPAVALRLLSLVDTEAWVRTHG